MRNDPNNPQTAPPIKQIKPLIVAFACEPDRGSEPGVGWHLVHSLSKIQPVWVITHPLHRNKLEAWLAKNDEGRINVSYYSLPRWCQWMWKSSPTLNFYYYFWQIGAQKIARALHGEHKFDVVQHASYVRYWMPSAGACLNIPFVWGPVGGGESAPFSFLWGMGFRGAAGEIIRSATRWVFEHLPSTKRTAKAATIGLAGSEESATRMRNLGASRVQVMSAIGSVSAQRAAGRDDAIVHPRRFRFISVAHLLSWKGIHLGLKAFAQANLHDAEYWIVGGGPDRARLEKLASKLRIADRVHFEGDVPHDQAQSKLSQCDVLVHPSLHDSGGSVLLEAMALKKLVICLDLGGPAVHVNHHTGFKIAARHPKQAIHDIAVAMKKLKDDRALLTRLGIASQIRASEEFSWDRKAMHLARIYSVIVAQPVEIPAADAMERPA